MIKNSDGLFLYWHSGDGLLNNYYANWNFHLLFFFRGASSIKRSKAVECKKLKINWMIILKQNGVWIGNLNHTPIFL
jgi:hypothetical protein